MIASTGSAGRGGEIDIRSGGAVAVDTDSLRAAAAVCASLAGRCDRLRTQLEELSAALIAHPETAWAPADLAYSLARDLDRDHERIASLARSLGQAADVFELAELAAGGSGAPVGAVGEASRLVRMHELAERSPEAVGDAAAALAAWRRGARDALTREVGAWAALAGTAGLTVPLGLAGLLGGVGVLGLGRVARGTRLVGAPQPVRLTAVPAPAVPAPVGVADLASRIPRGEAQVRVERYTDLEGRDRFVVYVAGTQAFSGASEQPFDMRSNLELYAGARSASYDAVVQALRDAGADAGDAVVAVGHSQGAAVTSHLTLAGEFDVQANITFGSPVDADLGDDALGITVRHTDDPVAALAGGGHPGVAGAPGSLVVERYTDPGISSGDVTLAAHQLETYTATAELIDASGDPRLTAVRGILGTLVSPAPAVVTTYQARRTG